MQTIKHSTKLILCKSGEMIYFSQLDLVRILERSLRRSNLPLYYTQGFNPKPKISFYGGLKLGVEGKIELALNFNEPISAQKLIKSLQPQLPTGLILSGE